MIAAWQRQKLDAKYARGDGITWVLVRLIQSNVGGQRGPWRREPQIDFLVRGRGEAAPADVGGHLLDGNPARAAYWFLTRRRGVRPSRVHAVWKQSAAICDEPMLVAKIEVEPRSTAAELDLALRVRGFEDVLIAAAKRASIDWFASEANRLSAFNAWKLERARSIVEAKTGRRWADLSAEQRAEVATEWNERFAGGDNAESVRSRYTANGVISADADPDQVLSDIAAAMAGSIQEIDGTWYVYAGSSAIRPGVRIGAEDVVSDLVETLTSPPLADQPDALTGRLVQDETKEWQRSSLGEIDRIDATIGAVDATTRPAFLTFDADGERRQPKRVSDVGDLTFVTNPFQAQEIMRIRLYQSRWTCAPGVCGFGRPRSSSDWRPASPCCSTCPRRARRRSRSASAWARPGARSAWSRSTPTPPRTCCCWNVRKRPTARSTAWSTITATSATPCCTRPPWRRRRWNASWTIKRRSRGTAWTCAPRRPAASARARSRCSAPRARS